MKAKSEKIGIGISTALTLGSIAFAFFFPLLGGEPQKEISWGEWVTTLNATCEEDGEEMRTSLTDPNLTETRAIPATGHSWGEWDRVSEPTCTVEGYKKRVCAYDETHIDYEKISALGHRWSIWETVVEPTCLLSGYETRTCLRDENHTDYRVLEALGHDWTGYVVTTPPTCTEAGEETKYCRNCNEHTQTDTVYALGHDWSEWVVTTQPTETEEGEETRVCRNDKTHTETRVVAPTGSEGLRYTLNAAGTDYAVACDYAVSPKGTVYIPATYNGLPVTTIGSSGFFCCNDIKRIVFLGNNLRFVRTNAFAHCESLISVEFPEGLEQIQPYVFYKCGSLKSVSFPASVTCLGKTSASSSIYHGLFRECPLIESITVADGNPVYKMESGCLIDKATNQLVAGTPNAVIPQTVTSIEVYAFYGQGIKSVAIPAGVQKIGMYAFENCTQLSSVTLAEGSVLTSIGGYAFAGCDSLEAFEIPASVTSISATSFSGAGVDALTVAADNTVYFKDGNCIITRETNALVAGGNSAVIPSFVTKIFSNAFRDRTMESIVIPEGVTSIGSSAFEGCASLKNVTFEGMSALETLGNSAFEDCTSLTGIVLPVGLRTIGDYAFENCTELLTVTFRSQDGTKSYTNSQLESIGSLAFRNSGLRAFVIPASVTDLAASAFYCENLTSLSVQKGNTVYKVESGCLMEIETETVLLMLNGAVIPKTAKEIKSSAFKIYTDARIEIPSSVEKLADYVLEYTKAGQTVVIKGFASYAEADEAWGTSWRSFGKATIVFEKD